MQSDMISLARRQKLMGALTLFANLSAKESRELALLMTEKKVAAGDVIVKEDELVDSVYLLAEGQAEVSHLLQPKKTKLKIQRKKSVIRKVPLAILNVGEAIGLNDTGFFSSTGKRTATVTALKNGVLLRLDLKNLQLFLRQHASLENKLLANTEQLLRINLIKHSLPFSRISHERLLWLANKIEIVHVKKGQLIFLEGEMGDRCYLIREGQVEIVAKNAAGEEHQLAILHAPALFGEATLITGAPRNASARALEACELFELQHGYLHELIESENNVASTFMNLMVDRSRPQQNSTILTYERTTADQAQIVILKNPTNGNYFKLSAEGWFIWEQMDGQKTMQEITLALADEFDVFAPDVVAALISKLAKAGFVTNVEHEKKIRGKKPTWIKILWALRRLLESRVAMGDADHWLTQLYQHAGYLLFKPISKILLTYLIVMGFFAFGFSTAHVIHLFRTIHDAWILLIFMIPAMLMSVALHELGHALATKSYGNEVHYMGIGWYWLGPVAFTDTSDMWLSTRWPRIFVNLAGVYTDVLVAGVSAMLIFVLPSAHVQAFLWLFALFTYISAFRMLNPLQELDGYYVLMDLFDRPRLRQSAVAWLVKDFPRVFRQPRLLHQALPEVCYWLVCILFLISVCILTLSVQTFIFKILGFHPSNPLISLSLPILAAVASGFGILADIREQADD